MQEPGPIAMQSILMLTLIFLSVRAWLHIARRWRASEPVLDFEPGDVVPWRGLDVVIVGVAALMIDALAQTSYGATAEGAAGPRLTVDTMVALALGRVAWLVLTPAYLTIRTGIAGVAKVFSTTRLGDDLRAGWWLFLAAVLPVFGLQLLLVEVVGWKSDHPLAELVRSQGTASVLVLTTLVAVLLAPLAEELFFRVLLQGWLERQQIARRAARGDESPRAGLMPTILSSALFAGMHSGHGSDPLPLFVLALFLGYAYRQTHRIWAPLTLHVCVNGLGMIELWLQYVHGSP